jgi:hypothetical protein
MLSDKTTEHICRLVDDSPPFTDDDLAALSTLLGRELLNLAPSRSRVTDATTLTHKSVALR